MPLLALRLAQPSILIDINRVPGLAEISPLPGGGLRIGALTRHRTLAAQSEHALLAEAARWIGHAAIRTRGTLGGSLAHADPAAELPVVAAAAGAVALATGPGGQRRIAAADLFTGALQTCLDDDELIEAVEFPALSRWGFAEFARRNGDFGLVIVAVAEVGGSLRLALGGVASHPGAPGRRRGHPGGRPVGRRPDRSGRRGRRQRSRARQRHPRHRRVPAAADPGPGRPRPGPGRRGTGRVRRRLNRARELQCQRPSRAD